MISGVNDRIAEIRLETKMSKKDFADYLGVSATVIGDVENGKIEPSKNLLLSVAVKYAISLDWLYLGIGDKLLSKKNISKLDTNNYKVPLLRQKVSCGPGTNWEDEQNIKEYIDIFALTSHLKPMRMFALSVQGNSMVGSGIRNGDYVLFNAGGDQYFGDGIYVFALDGEVYCKLLEFDRISGKIKIYSVRVADLEKAELLTTLNREDADFADRFTIFGRVVSWVHPNLHE